MILQLIVCRPNARMYTSVAPPPPLQLWFDYVLLFLGFLEYEETCLFIIARFSASESLRVYINILKIPPPFASSDGYPASGIYYESVAREFSEPRPHSYSLATARRRVHFSSRFLISLFAFYSYISSYSYLIITSTVI